MAPSFESDQVQPALRIPPGSNISISMYMTHRNPNLWNDPERFDPERFAPAAVAQRHRFAYLPFGGGPRICIGNRFAMMEATLILAALAQRFTFAATPETRLELLPTVTLRPRGPGRLQITARARGA